jgi:hypothetical protein
MIKKYLPPAAIAVGMSSIGHQKRKKLQSRKNFRPTLWDVPIFVRRLAWLSLRAILLKKIDPKI